MDDLSKLIDCTPQAGVLHAEDRRRWLEGITRYHRARAGWHVKRLHGLGGSEIGAVLRHYLSVQEGGFSNIKRVVEQKLLKRLPEYETIHMRRGTALEDLARMAFMFKYGAQQDRAAMEAMSRPHSKTGYEWLVGNPDDYVIIKGKRWLADYKVPSTYDDEIPFDYKAQLHHYELGGRFRGIKTDGGLLLAKLDLAPELALSLTQKITQGGGVAHEDLVDMARMIAKANIPGLRIMAHIVDIDRDMQLDILSCGSECWNEMVLRGVVPDMGKGERLQVLEDEKNLRVFQYQQQYAMAKAAAAQLEQIAAAASQALKQELSTVDLSKVSLPATLVTATEKVSLDKEAVIAEAMERGATEEEIAGVPVSYSIPALLDEIKRLGGNVDAPELKVAAGPDVEKAKAFLAARQIDLAPFQSHDVSVGLSRKKDDKESHQALQQLAGEQFQAWLAEMTAPASAVSCDSQVAEVEAQLRPVSDVFGFEGLDEYFEDEPEVSRPQRRMSM